MEWTIISLLGAGIILLILSFFQKDGTKDVEKQLENVSIQLMQEMYHLKKKVSLLEEEYMLNTSQSEEKIMKPNILSRDDVLTMYEDGYSVPEIAGFTSRTEEEIGELLSK